MNTWATEYHNLDDLDEIEYLKDKVHSLECELIEERVVIHKLLLENDKLMYSGRD